MIIEKKQSDLNHYRLAWHFFMTAREALAHILLHEEKKKKILLPAYIGYSSREGSGVFDPVTASGIDYDFYSLDRSLNIDLDDLTKKMNSNKGNILLLIHYFGFKDIHLQNIRDVARRNDIVIIDDFAHAFYTFWRNPTIDFDYAIFSTHKMFPVESGGALLSKKRVKKKNTLFFNYFSYDISAIIRKRRRNYSILLKGLKQFPERYGIEILHETLAGAVPQSFPLLLKNEQLRDALYFELNNRGYGVVSLYHQLISEIPPSHEREIDLSKRILNLPVHQDADEKQLRGLLSEMLSTLEGY